MWLVAALPETLFYFCFIIYSLMEMLQLKLIFNMKKGKRKYPITFSRQSQPLAYFPISFPESFCVCVCVLFFYPYPSN